MKKNFIKKNKKLITAAFLSALTTSLIIAPGFIKDQNQKNIMHSVNAEEETPFSWTEENKELAWACYYATDWNNVGTFMFSSDGSYSRFKKNQAVSKDGIWLEVMTAVCNEALNQVNIPTWAKKDDLHNLMLAFCYATGADRNHYKEDEIPPENTDANYLYWLNRRSCNLLNKYYGGTWSKIEEDIENVEEAKIKCASPDSVEVKALVNEFNNFVKAAEKYKEKYGVEVSIYNLNDDSFDACCQAAIYGTGYIEKNKTYTQENAKKYYKNNSKLKEDIYWDNFSTFAMKIKIVYSAIKATGHEVIG